MTLARAQAAADQLRTALLDNGVRRVSIELQPGVASSGWYVNTFKRGMGHHIASYPPGTPGLALVKKGRTGTNALTGPLCNGYGGFDLTARIITMGWANHPGEGGPWSVPGWGTVPRNDGRPRIFGWEFEGGYLDYTDEMHDFMARCGAGTLDWLGTLPGNPGPAPLACWGEHKEPWAPGRKTDRIGYTAASGRARIAAVRGGAAPASRPSTPTAPLEDFLMTLTDAEQHELLALARRGAQIDERLLIEVMGPDENGDGRSDEQGIPTAAGRRTLQQMVASVPADVWARGVAGINGIGPDGQPTYGDVPAGTRLGNLDTKTALEIMVPAITGSVSLLLAAQPGGSTLTPEVIKRAVEEGVNASLAAGLRTAAAAVAPATS